jgi:hypothetical protein
VVEVDLVMEWLHELGEESHDLVIAALELLAEQGPALGRPLADRVAGSRHHHMKELRPGSVGRTKLRILFAFDPKRTAVLLVAGNKQGQWQKWYEDNIPVAEDLYDEHLKRLKEVEEK